MSNCLLVCALIFITTGCSDDEVLSIPEAPQFVAKSSDTAKYNQGIRPTYNSKGIYLEWYQNNENDLAGYNLYKTTQFTIAGSGDTIPVNFQLLRKIPLGSEDGLTILSDTSFQDFNVETSSRYYYRLTAFSKSDGESTPSIENPSYELKSYPTLDAPAGQFQIPVNKKLTFKWTNDPSAAGTYTVKVYTENPFSGQVDIVARAIIDNTGFGGGDSVTFDFNSLNASIDGNRNITVYKLLEADPFGVIYNWYVFYSESTIDLLTGSISESAFSLIN